MTSRYTDRSSSGRYVDPRANAYSDIDSGGWDSLPPVSMSKAQPRIQAESQTFPPRQPAPYNGAYATPPVAAAYRDEATAWSAPQARSQRYEHEEPVEDEDEYVPPIAEAPPPGGAYIAWQGVTYEDPSKAVVQEPTREELMAVLAPIRDRREAARKGDAQGDRAARGPPRGLDFGGEGDNGWGSRAGGGDKVGEDGWGDGGDDSWGGGGRGGGYSGGGGGSGNNNCFNCDQPGHRSAECTEERKPRGGGSGECFNCGEHGHMSKECPNERKGGGGGDCFNCGQAGHFSRECPNERVERSGGGGGGSCYNCGEAGHFSRECPNDKVEGAGSGGRTCYNCGQPGHQAFECTEERVPGNFRGECHNCGERGHQSRDCEQPRQAGHSRGTCHNCGETGHQSRDCQQPRSETRYGEGGAAWSNEAAIAAVSGWGEEPATPASIHDKGDDDGWGAPTSNRHNDVPHTPVAETSNTSDHCVTPSQNNEGSFAGTPAPAPARAAPGIHPDRLKMLGGQGAAAEYVKSPPTNSYSNGYNKSSPLTSTPVREREVPPYMRSLAPAPTSAPASRYHEPDPEPAPATVDTEFGGW